MGQSYDGSERRKSLRIFKNFSLLFYLKDSADKKYAGSFIKDISKGGLRFTTSKPLNPGAQVVFEIGIPYIAPKKLILEGTVIASKDVSSLVHEIRARFNVVDIQAKELLDMIEKRNKG